MKDKITLFEIPDQDERGVSPVIGVILMVAITVILAAVIASFVLGFGSQTSQSANAGVSVEDTGGDTVEVTVISLGENAEAVMCTSDESNTAQVGDTITCDRGDNVVAIGSGSAQNSTIRTNIGN